MPKKRKWGHSTQILPVLHFWFNFMFLYKWDFDWIQIYFYYVTESTFINYWNILHFPHREYSGSYSLCFKISPVITSVESCDATVSTKRKLHKCLVTSHPSLMSELKSSNLTFCGQHWASWHHFLSRLWSASFWKSKSLVCPLFHLSLNKQSQISSTTVRKELQLPWRLQQWRLQPPQHDSV